MKPFEYYLSTVRFVYTTCLSLFSSHKLSALMIVCVMILAGAYYGAFTAPSGFVPGITIRIMRGASVPEIATELADARIIAHPTVLRAVLRLSGASGNVHTGIYQFKKPQNVLVIAYRLVSGDYGLPPVRLLFTEGMTVREAALRIASSSLEVSAEDFLKVAQPQEGYLFPDTYFFSPSADAESIIATMHSNFDTKIASLSGEIAASGHSLSDIVIVASLVEKETRTSADRYTVAGILWNRIKLGMPLQVDAVFGYIFNRATYSPSPADLKVNSPYNTYTHTGLPPGPIDNPGLDALEAAANPAKTSYLYYLTGHDGLMHYATTYAGHQANLRKYLY